MAEIVAENQEASGGREEVESGIGRRRIWRQERRRRKYTLILLFCHLFSILDLFTTNVELDCFTFRPHC